MTDDGMIHVDGRMDRLSRDHDFEELVTDARNPACSFIVVGVLYIMPIWQMVCTVLKLSLY
jgi:hypothetical protein